MIRWASCGLVLAFASVASAQSKDVIIEVQDLLSALKVRPNPFGGAPLPQGVFPLAGQQATVQMKLLAAVPPGAIVPPNAEMPFPGGVIPRPIRPVFTLPGAPKLDRHGDPLPSGAIVRYGTVRLRH